MPFCAKGNHGLRVHRRLRHIRFYTREIDEAFYLTAILNSEGVNSLIKDFQTRGCLAQGCYKKDPGRILPTIDRKNATHSSLAEFSEKAHEAANAFIRISDPQAKSHPGS